MHTCMCTPDLGQQPLVPLILDPPWSFFNPSNHLPVDFYWHFCSPTAEEPLNTLPFGAMLLALHVHPILAFPVDYVSILSTQAEEPL